MALYKKGIYNKKSLQTETLQILIQEYFKLESKLNLTGVPKVMKNGMYHLEDRLHTAVIKFYIPINELCDRLNLTKLTFNKWVNSSNIEVVKDDKSKPILVELHSFYDFLNSD